MVTSRHFCLPLVVLLSAVLSHAQAPSLFLSTEDIQARLQVAKQQPWAKRSLDLLLQEADDFPASYKTRFGTPDAAPPPEGGAWLHWYACPESGRPLQFHPPDQNICPDTGKNFAGYPYDHVVYQLRNDALSEAAVASALAYRFTGKAVYATKAAEILKSYTHVYPTYKLHDINNKPGPNGGMAYAQTLDESIWLIKIAWTYDLIRDQSVMTAPERQAFEHDVLRASAATMLKAHKEPTYNIQSWINGAAGAVGFVLNDQALITEAIDGPIGFRHQMQQFVHEGFWAEGAWGYQFYAMRPLTMLAQMATRKGINLWKQEPNLLALFHSPLGVVLPDGTLPAFNDSGAPDLYEYAFLYEVAYAYTKDATLLTVMEHGQRGNREAFLFGVETLPRVAAPKLASVVFPEAGYATLRSPSNDLTAVMKFGPHGGAHGHYDKLNFVLYAHGMLLAEDPGTHFYGLPIHREWDSMTIAHNTISVDGTRQSQATGKLLDWHAGEGWTAVRADAGAAYSQANLQRTMLLTPNYVLIIDRCKSTDGKPHTFDFAYHNIGTESVGGSVDMQPYSFTGTNGYQHLSHVKRGSTSDLLTVRFVTEKKQSDEAHSDSNSTPATLDSAPRLASDDRPMHADLQLQMLASPGTELLTGDAPTRSSQVPVPFIIARRSGKETSFITLLGVSQEPASGLRLTRRQDGQLQIEAAHWVDTFSDSQSPTYKHLSR